MKKKTKMLGDLNTVGAHQRQDSTEKRVGVGYL